VFHNPTLNVIITLTAKQHYNAHTSFVVCVIFKVDMILFHVQVDCVMHPKMGECDTEMSEDNVYIYR